MAVEWPGVPDSDPSPDLLHSLARTMLESTKKPAIVLSKDYLVGLRQARDRQLDPPRLLYPSVQFNVNGGRFFAPGRTGIRYFKIPVNLRRQTSDVGEIEES